MHSSFPSIKDLALQALKSPTLQIRKLRFREVVSLHTCMFTKDGRYKAQFSYLTVQYSFIKQT